MRRLWNEFKNFAMSGSMIDLALGFIIGAAFAKIIDSLTTNVLMQLIAVIFGKPDFTELVLTVNGGQINYGQFLTDLVSFLLLAALLFVVVKMMIFIGIGRGRIFSTQDCPFCGEQIGAKAIVCKNCGSALVDDLPSPSAARALMENQNRRKTPSPFLPAASRPRSKSPRNGADRDQRGRAEARHASRPRGPVACRGRAERLQRLIGGSAMPAGPGSANRTAMSAASSSSVGAPETTRISSATKTP